MKVGDLVRIKSRFRNAPIGLIVDTDDPAPANTYFVKVQWFGNQCKYDQYRSPDELEVINESR
jgi:hypothetical protein